jgi:uncharacterized protein
MDPLVEPKAPDYAALIAAELGIPPRSVAAVIALLDEGATVPFIARYRKEATGGAEDVVIAKTEELVTQQREFFERKKTILQSIHEQGKLTPELRTAIEGAATRTVLEDLYLPYRPKRRTRATIAKEKGLEPLAERMWAQADTSGTPEDAAREFVNAEKGVETVEDALAGARPTSPPCRARARARESWPIRRASRRITRGRHSGSNTRPRPPITGSGSATRTRSISPRTASPPTRARTRPRRERRSITSWCSRTRRTTTPSGRRTS